MISIVRKMTQECVKNSKSYQVLFIKTAFQASQQKQTIKSKHQPPSPQFTHSPMSPHSMHRHTWTHKKNYKETEGLTLLWGNKTSGIFYTSSRQQQGPLHKTSFSSERVFNVLTRFNISMYLLFLCLCVSVLGENTVANVWM